MTLVALGISYRTARVEQRERVSLANGRATNVLQSLARDDRIDEVVAFSTCNRAELYATLHSTDEGRAVLSEALRVAASLGSMVIGESEIQGQVRAALRLAEAHSTAREQLRGEVSISSVAVELARQALPDLEQRYTVLIGAGHTAEATAGALAAVGAQLATVANRSLLAAQELAERFGGRGSPLELVREELRSADIVICSTESSDPILALGDVLPAIEGRRGRPLVLIDIAVPRDVEPAVRHLPGVLFSDLDDLERVAHANLSRRLTSSSWPGPE